MNTMRNSVNSLINLRYLNLLRFWQNNEEIPEGASLQDHCDIVYTLALSEMRDTIHQSAAIRFAEIIAGKNIAGFSPKNPSPTISVHNTAYVLGALNLLGQQTSDLYKIAVDQKEPRIQDILHVASFKPIFPAKWAHHNWRVSHWIGGVPSIIASVANSDSRHSTEFQSILLPVRDAIDSLIEPDTGLLKAYRSDFVQRGFRILYALRHNPTLGDVGGIAHVLWFDHLTDRAYVGGRALYDQASKLFLEHSPFMEKLPYCLDFDIVQIVRTAGEQFGFVRADLKTRAISMMNDIDLFFNGEVPAQYSLHKIPGALATYHECALMSGEPGSLRSAPVDIIKNAYWL